MEKRVILILIILALVAAPAHGILIGTPSIDPEWFSVENSIIPDANRNGSPTTGSSGYHFIENKGQWNHEIRFAADTGSGQVLVRDNGMELHLPGVNKVITVKYEFIEPQMFKLEGVDELPTLYNFYMGNDPSKWANGARAFREVHMLDVWNGIDLRLYFTEGQLKYDIIVHPGSDPDDAGFRMSGVDEIFMDGGDLLFTSDGEVILRERGLLAFQGDGDLVVEAGYTIGPEREFSFDIGEYDKTRTLVIDPLIFGNYIGGSFFDEVMDSELDAQNNHYLTGYTTSFDFPVTDDAFTNASAGEDIFLTKINSSGTEILYSTYIGGTLNERGLKMELDGAGNAYITGFTTSMNLPTTDDAINRTLASTMQDAFLIKVDTTTGELSYSTYIGGSDMDEGRDISMADDGDILITGYTRSPDFPTTAGAYTSTTSGNKDVILLRMASDLSDLVFSTTFGSEGYDEGKDLSILPDGRIVVSGETDSDDLEMVSGSYDPSFASIIDSFIYVFSSDGSTLLASTYFGGDNVDYCSGLDTDEEGDIYLAGTTLSGDLPTDHNSYQRDLNKERDLYVVKFDGGLRTLKYCTYIGSQFRDETCDIIVDERGRVNLAGQCFSTTFPLTWGAFQTYFGGTSDGVFLILNSTGSGLLYSTYFGGDEDERCNTLELLCNNRVLLAGYTLSQDMPTSNSGFGHAMTGSGDGFAVAIDLSLPPEVPINLSVASTPPIANITWEPPVHDGGTPVTGYVIERTKIGDTPRVRTFEVGSQPLFNIDEDIDIGNSYIYRISARNSAGIGNMTEGVLLHNYMPPTRPRNFRAVHLNGTINLTWAEPGYNGSAPITHYVLERSVQNGTDLQTWNITSTNFDDTNITKGTDYHYSLWAYNGYWLSDVPGELDITPIMEPTPPADVTVRSGNRFVNLSWEEPEDTGGIPIVAYHVYRGLNPDSFNLISTVLGDNRSYNDTSVVNGVEYLYVVLASNGRFISNRSRIIAVKPIGQPGPPWNLGIRIDNTVVHLDWDPPTTDGGSKVIEYWIYRWIPGFEPQVLIRISGNRTYFNDTTVLANSIYYYFITALSALGESEPSNTMEADVMGHPTDPRSLKAVPGPGFVTLEWLPPSDTGHSRLLGYRLYKRTGEEKGSLLAELSADEEFYIDLDIEPGKIYVYWITAFNDIGESRPSPDVQFSPVGKPSPPGNLLAYSSEDMIELTWSQPSDSGGVPLVSYHIFRGPDAGNMTFYRTVSSQRTSFVDDDVEVGVRYYYQMISFNGVYNSSMSQLAKGIPKGLPGQVKDCEASLVNGSIEITWSEPENTGGTDILYYHIYKRNATGFFVKIAKVAAYQFRYLDQNIQEPGLYVYYIVAENEIGIGPQSVKFEEDIPSSYFDDGGTGLGAGTIGALVFLGISLLIAIIAVMVFIRRKTRKDEPEMMPTPVQDLYEPQPYIPPEQQYSMDTPLEEQENTGQRFFEYDQQDLYGKPQVDEEDDIQDPMIDGSGQYPQPDPLMDLPGLGSIDQEGPQQPPRSEE